MAHCATRHISCLQQALCLVFRQDKVDITVAADDYRTLLMDRRGHDVQKALELPLEQPTGGRSPRLLDYEGHRKAFVQHPQFSKRRFVVGRVQINAPVQEGAVDIRHHGAHIPCGVRLGALLETRHHSLDCLVPIGTVALIAAVDLLATTLGQLHMGLGVYELPKRGVKREAVHAMALEGNDELGGSTVHAITRHNNVIAGPQNITHGGWSSTHLLVHRKDRPCANVAVNVAAPVQWVEGDHEAPSLGLWHKDRVLILLRHEHGASTAICQGVNEDVVRQHVQLFLIIPG
mmetsp:Transcript_35041/g.57287  ORF Transcript_35041/g.57287 Transcript_35041/m.57287 type:complete len:290 (+) Transcript_35041:2356-3225(+)